jgi:hypothetical protein
MEMLLKYYKTIERNIVTVQQILDDTTSCNVCSEEINQVSTWALVPRAAASLDLNL